MTRQTTPTPSSLPQDHLDSLPSLLTERDGYVSRSAPGITAGGTAEGEGNRPPEHLVPPERLRLGRRARDLLLAAAGARGEVVITALGMGESEARSCRRAARTLARAGLVRVRLVERKTYDGRARCQAIIVTPLGMAVAECFARELRTGERIRWRRMVLAVRSELESIGEKGDRGEH